MRAHARYPTTMTCWLELNDGQRVDGIVEDISMGGVGIRVNQELSSIGDFTTVLAREGEPLRIACNVRHTRDLWQTRFIHARFRRLSAEQHRAVEEIVGALARAGSAQERPAGTLRRLVHWLPPRT